MYILTTKKSGGVYAIENRDHVRTVQMFVDKDDAVRYHGLLLADDYKEPLEVTEVDENAVIENCNMFGYKYCIIEPNDFVVPPR